MPYQMFTKLYDSMVWPVVSYGAAVQRNKTYSCINTVQNRAMRYCLGTGKYSSNAAVSGNMGWQTPSTVDSRYLDLAYLEQPLISK